MSWFHWLLTQWVPLLLLLNVLGRQTGLQVVKAILCSRWGTPSNKGLSQEGDVIIGGLLNLYYVPSALEQGFTRLPQYKPCTG